MEDDEEQRPDSLLPYEKWIESALRHVVAQAIEYVSTEGLPGGHHFYLTFRTDHPGVSIPQRLRTQYPQEMTIVLQHQFWDLKFDRDTGQISVGLSFGGVPSTLVIPLDAMIGFADPHIRYGLRFQPIMPEAQATPAEPGDSPAVATREDQTPAQEKPAEQPQVVSLDAFRRRTPPKT
jgi:hypothetical protein